MKEIISHKEIEVIGRGTVYVTSLKENNLHINDINIGQSIIINGVVRKIKNVEMARDGFGVVKDGVGIIAV
jgi:hypothetical protein